MKTDLKFVIARAVRNHRDLIAEVTLIWLPHYSKLSVEHRTVTKESNVLLVLPDTNVRKWLPTFDRDQGRLHPDSYFITEYPTNQWWQFLNMDKNYRD